MYNRYLMPNKQWVVRCETALLEKIDHAAKIEGVSRNTLVIDVLKAYIGGNDNLSFKNRHAALIEEVKKAVLEDLRDNPPHAEKK